LIFFLFFSTFYLQIVYSIHHGVSALDFVSFSRILQGMPVLLGLFAVTLITIFRAQDISKGFFIFFVAHIFYSSFSLFFLSFNKTILVLNFIFILTAFYFFLFWYLELEEAIYRPGFSNYQIGRKTEYDFNVVLESANGKTVPAVLSNWDENGCFLLPVDDLTSVNKGKCLLKINYENRDFQEPGEVVTRYGIGRGVRFYFKNKKGVDHHGWKEFYAIIRDRGFSPRLTAT
jgi:hypothetical protein